MSRNQPTGPKPTDLEKIQGVSQLFGRIQFVKNVISWILVGAYTWLQIRNLPYPEIINGTRPSIALQFSLIVMYLCWARGLTLDINTEALVFVSDPNRGKLPASFYVTSLVLFAAAVALLQARNNVKIFAAALTFFSIVCLWMLLAGRKRLRDIITDSREIYKAHADFIGEEQLEIVEHYAAGKWVWIRQSCLLSLLAAVDVICWVGSISDTISGSAHTWDPDISKEAVAGLVPLAAIITFLVIAESWQWYMRIKMRFSVMALRELKEKNYRVERAAELQIGD